jgi:hypothetical protein
MCDKKTSCNLVVDIKIAPLTRPAQLAAAGMPSGGAVTEEMMNIANMVGR